MTKEVNFLLQFVCHWPVGKKMHLVIRKWHLSSYMGNFTSETPWSEHIQLLGMVLLFHQVVFFRIHTDLLASFETTTKSAVLI